MDRINTEKKEEIFNRVIPPEEEQKMLIDCVCVLFFLCFLTN